MRKLSLNKGKRFLPHHIAAQIAETDVNAGQSRVTTPDHSAV